jgi:hypothetical protein
VVAAVSRDDSKVVSTLNKIMKRAILLLILIGNRIWLSKKNRCSVWMRRVQPVEVVLKVRRLNLLNPRDLRS